MHMTNGLQIETIPVECLKISPYHARKASRTQERRLAKGIAEFGFLVPVLVERDGTLISGHARAGAARLAGLTEVPAIRVEHLSEAQIRAFRLFDNRIQEDAEWDPGKLAIEFTWLSEAGFDLALTGFEIGEIDFTLGNVAADGEPETVPEPDTSIPAVTRTGDVWCVGRHRLVCGDALERETYSLLLDGEAAQMVFTDPPYNVRIDGHVSGKGAVRHREFAMASGEMSREAFTLFLRTAFTRLAEVSSDGAIHFVCMDWRHMAEVIDAAEGVYSELKNLCVWGKTNAGMGTFYRSQHELVFAYKSGTAPHINTFGLGEGGRHRSNLWTYAGANTFRSGRTEDLAAHPTVKPVQMVADAILDCSKPGGLVLDPFGGSGTTLLAAERTGRRGAAVEIDPQYCDLILARLSETTGVPARLLPFEETFDEVAEARRQDSAA